MSSPQGDLATEQCSVWWTTRLRALMLAVSLVLAFAVTMVAVRSETGVSTHTGLDLSREQAQAAGDREDRADGQQDKVIGFVPYWDQEQGVAEVEDNLDTLSTVAPWWYSPTATGEVVVQHEGRTNIDRQWVASLQQRGRKVMPAIANHQGGSWDYEVVGQILSDEDRTANHVREITELVVDQGYDGIQIDYEELAAQDRDAYSEFVDALARSLKRHDKTLAVTVHAKTTDAGDGEHNEAQDYAAIGRAADEVHIMTYDYHWEESSAGPIAPRSWAAEVIEYALTQMPADKIVLGIGLFGYDWDGAPLADGLTLEEVEERKRQYEGESGWDTDSQSPWFRYSADGVDHEVWFENTMSVSAKLELVDCYDLAGIFVWRLGGIGPEMWDVIRRYPDNTTCDQGVRASGSERVGGETK